MFSPEFKVALVKEIFKQENACESFHDVAYEAIDESLSEPEAHLLFFHLPEDIQCDALKWGVGDTEVRDNIYNHLIQNEGKNNG